MGCHRVLKQLPSAICHHRNASSGKRFRAWRQAKKRSEQNAEMFENSSPKTWLRVFEVVSLHLSIKRCTQRPYDIFVIQKLSITNFKLKLNYG